jgi:hypothetical protein
VLISRSLEGVIVQAGDTSMNEAGVRRDEARMVAAVKNLTDMGFLEQTGDDVYQITEKGFKFLDN